MFPEQFDSLGPSVKQLLTEKNRVVHFIDDGDFNDFPVVFVGGLGTSVRAIRLLDFLRTMRKDLGIRIISIERNGFGQTEFNSNLTISDYVQDVEEVLNHLKINKNLIPLGGISSNNLNNLNNVSCKGLALLSEIKKKPAKIFNRLF